MSEEKHPALELTEAERVDYLTVVASMAAADGHVDDVEISRLRESCKALKLDAAGIGTVIAAAEQPDETRLDEILERLKGAKTRFTLITDVLFMAHADDDYDSAERVKVLRLAEAVGVTADQVVALEKYVEALKKGGKADAGGVSEKDLKKLGGDVAATLASAGVPVAAVAVSGSVFGLSAAGITSGLATLGLGMGMTGGLFAVAALGAGTFFGVRWLYKKAVERDE